MVCVEMLNQNERATRVRREPLQEAGERFEPASGRTNTDDGDAVWNNRGHFAACSRRHGCES